MAGASVAESGPDVHAVPALPAGHPIAPGYEVLDHISRGQALDVYEVFSAERLCSCVAKVVRPDRQQDERVRDRLLNEGHLLHTLAHPHLARALETILEPGPIVILETIAGPSLEDALDEAVRRPAVTGIPHLGRHLCSVVHYLHGQGYLHLDIRPANVMTRCGLATLIDLSLARPPGPTRGGVGTRRYMAPEQARGGNLTAAIDVWGIGATLYETISGVPPFAPFDEKEEQLCSSGEYLQLHRQALPLHRWRRRLPPELCGLVERCLDPVPERRPPVLELYAELGELLPPEPPEGPEPSTTGSVEEFVAGPTGDDRG